MEVRYGHVRRLGGDGNSLTPDIPDFDLLQLSLVQCEEDIAETRSDQARRAFQGFSEHFERQLLVAEGILPGPPIVSLI